MSFLETKTFAIISLIINIVLIVMVIISYIRIRNINKNNASFMKKLGDGKNIQEDLEKYIQRVINLEEGLSETNTYCKQLDGRIQGCVQKIGVVRYSAYKDSGSDLSFAVALLDEKNNGVVFNGIYSREMSNIYAKPIENGVSKYSMTAEENQALLKAMKS